MSAVGKLTGLLDIGGIVGGAVVARSIFASGLFGVVEFFACIGDGLRKF